MPLASYVRPAVNLWLALVDRELAADDNAPAPQQPIPVTPASPVVEANSALVDSARMTRVDAVQAEPNVEPVTTGPGPLRAVTPATTEASNAAAIMQPPAVCKMVRGSCKILWSHFDLPDSYMFERRPFSMRKMTHVVVLSFNSGDSIPACSLDATERAQVINALDHVWPAPGGHNANFNGPDLLVSCNSQWKLKTLFDDIEEVVLGPCRARIKAKGLPLLPAFWLIKGVNAYRGKDELSAEAQGYIARNEKMLGKWRVVYASSREIPCVGYSYLTGDLVILTDTETIPSNNVSALPVFQGSKPRRLQSIQNLRMFGATL